jgi:hypothetical protein
MADSTLQAIRTKVRRLTRSLSEDILPTTDIDNYVNTFVLYDFPEHLRLFNLLSTFTFYTEPYQDVYTTSTDINSPFFNFINNVITVNPPIYIAGYQALFMESESQFYGIYPKLATIASIGIAGDGSTTQFSGVVTSAQSNVPPTVTLQGTILVKNQVLFSSIANDSSGLAMIDYPISASIGNLYVPGTAPTSTSVQDPNNYINYLTGQFVVTFVSAPGVGQPINSQTLPQVASLPQAMLFYDGSFTLRPIPDQPYAVTMEVFIQPTQLLTSNQSPDLAEWWQYIAYGAAKKVFEDRMDLESVAQILPEFTKQQNLINRRTIVQQTTQRTQTIYTQDTGAAGAYGPGYWSGGGSM